MRLYTHKPTDVVLLKMNQCTCYVNILITTGIVALPPVGPYDHWTVVISNRAAKAMSLPIVFELREWKASWERWESTKTVVQLRRSLRNDDAAWAIRLFHAHGHLLRTATNISITVAAYS